MSLLVDIDVFDVLSCYNMNTKDVFAAGFERFIMWILRQRLWQDKSTQFESRLCNRLLRVATFLPGAIKADKQIKYVVVVCVLQHEFVSHFLFMMFTVVQEWNATMRTFPMCLVVQCQQ